MKNHLLIISLVVSLLFPALVLAATTKEVQIGGLVGYWPLDESSGPAYDHSGRGNTGSLVGSPSRTTGVFGNGLLLNGSSQYVNAGNGASLNLTKGTVSVWIKGPSCSGGDGGFCGIVVKQNAYSVMLLSNTLGFYDWGGAAFRSTGVNVADSQWHHVVLTFQSGVTNGTLMYLDGVLKLTTTMTISSQANNLLIGYGNSTTQYYNGTVDDVRVYNRLLTASEVSSLYRNTAKAKLGASGITIQNGTTLSSGLVGYWTLDGSKIVNNVIDSSANGNAGYLTGFTSTSSAETSGKLGGALLFRGNGGGAVNIPGFTSSTLSNYPLTISLWAKLIGNQALAGLIGQNSSASGWRMQIDTANNRLQFRSDTTTGTAPVSTIPNYALWNHYLITIDASGNLTYYVNGASVGTNAGVSALNWASSNLVIGNGGNLNAGSLEFNGPIDEVRMYNRVLSASEIKQLYQMTNDKVNAPVTTLTSGTTFKNTLVGHWTFDGSNFSDKVYDSSGNANNGYADGSVATSSMKTIGKSGQAILLNGSSSYVLVPDSASLNPGTGSFSVSAWVKEASCVPSMVIAAKSNGGGASSSYGWHLGVFGGTCAPQLHFATGASFTTISNSNGLTAGKWYHIVAVVDENNIANSVMYINASAVGTGVSNGGNSGPVTNTVPLAIGNESDGGFSWNGAIDDLRIYDRALTQAEVTQLYNLSK